MKKQTAVEWLVEQFSKNGYIGFQDELQAKAMEMEQIIEAYWAGSQNWDSEQEAEPSYKENYNNTQS